MVQVQNESRRFKFVGNAQSLGGEGRGEEAVPQTVPYFNGSGPGGGETVRSNHYSPRPKPPIQGADLDEKPLVELVPQISCN